MKKHSLIYITAAAIMVLCLAACNNGNTGQEVSDADKPKNQVNSYANEPANLVVFSAAGTPEESWNERFGNDLKKKFPNYKISYIRNGPTSLSQIITSGEQVDIIYDSVGNAVNSVIPYGLQFDVSELVKKHHIDLNRFEPTMLDAVKQFGGLYGLPVQGGGLVMYYNKDIFDKFGVAYPKDGMFWEEAIELGKKLTRKDNGTQYIGLGPSLNHILSMNSYSLPYVDKTTERAAINNEKYKKIVETLALAPAQADGYKEKVAALNRAFNNDDFMKERFIAMFFMNFGLQDQEAFSSMNWDMAALPVFRDNPGVGTQPYPNLMFITNQSKYKDQALEVLNYITSDDYQMASSKRGFIPVIKNKTIMDAFGQETKHKDKNLVKAIFTNKFADPIVRTRYDSQVNTPLLKNMISVIKGEMDLNTALRTTEESANKAIEAAKR
jgi:multiple sugar transport system substrate-binding protein